MPYCTSAHSTITAIAGGIGAGKSVVSRMLRAMGYDVYDCDTRARAIMDADRAMQELIAEQVCREAVTPGGIDRACLAHHVFANPDALERLNSIVHVAVRADIRAWRGSRSGRLFVETAILYQSGLDRMVDEVWIVEAPRELRIERAMARSGLTFAQAAARIDAQESFVPSHTHPRTIRLLNDGVTPLLPRILSLLG